MWIVMHLVNTSIATSSQTLLPWTILCINEAEHSVADFLRSIVRLRIGDIECELVSA